MKHQELINNIEQNCIKFFAVLKAAMDLDDYLASIYIFQVIAENVKNLPTTSPIRERLDVSVVGNNNKKNWFSEFRNDTAHMTTIPIDVKLLESIVSFIREIDSSVPNIIFGFSEQLNGIKSQYESNPNQPNLKIRKLLFLAKNLADNSLAQILVAQTLGNLATSLYEESSYNIRGLLSFAKHARNISAHNLTVPESVNFKLTVDLFEEEFHPFELSQPQAAPTSTSSSSTSAPTMKTSVMPTKVSTSGDNNFDEILQQHQLQNAKQLAEDKAFGSALTLITNTQFAALVNHNIEWNLPIRYELSLSDESKYTYGSKKYSHSFTINNRLSTIESLPRYIYLTPFALIFQSMHENYPTEQRKREVVILTDHIFQKTKVDVNICILNGWGNNFEPILQIALEKFLPFTLCTKLLDLNAQPNIAGSHGEGALTSAVNSVIRYKYCAGNQSYQDALAFVSLLITRGANFHGIVIRKFYNEKSNLTTLADVLRNTEVSQLLKNPIFTLVGTGFDNKQLFKLMLETSAFIPEGTTDFTFLKIALDHFFKVKGGVIITYTDLYNSISNTITLSKCGDPVTGIYDISKVTEQESDEILATAAKEVSLYFKSVMPALYTLYNVLNMPSAYPIHYAIITNTVQTSLSNPEFKNLANKATPALDLGEDYYVFDGMKAIAFAARLGKTQAVTQMLGGFSK